MDLVYPLGLGSKWANNELKYSLRSVEKYCNDLGKVFIIGEKPDYLANIHHISMPDGAISVNNIWAKVLKACDTEEISDDFLFMNDDFFFLKEFSTNYPYYHKGEISTNEYVINYSAVPYYKLVKRTMNVIKSKGAGSLHFDIHRPIVINKKKFIECFNFFSEHLNTGMVMKSTYCNYLGIEGKFKEDLKLQKKDISTYRKTLKTADMFSISDNFITLDFENYMNNLFPNKSKYEL